MLPAEAHFASWPTGFLKKTGWRLIAPRFYAAAWLLTIAKDCTHSLSLLHLVKVLARVMCFVRCLSCMLLAAWMPCVLSFSCSCCCSCSFSCSCCCSWYCYCCCCCCLLSFLLHPGKINMEHENGALEDYIPLQPSGSQVL